MNHEEFISDEQTFAPDSVIIISDIHSEYLNTLQSESTSGVIVVHETPRNDQNFGIDTMVEIRKVQKQVGRGNGILLLGEVFPVFQFGTMRSKAFMRTRFYTIWRFAHEAGFKVYFILGDEARSFMELILASSEIDLPYSYMQRSDVLTNLHNRRSGMPGDPS